MKDFRVHWVRGLCGNSVGISTGFSVFMVWVWELKSNSHGSLANAEMAGLRRKYK